MLDPAAPVSDVDLLDRADVVVVDGTPGRDLAAVRAALPTDSAAVVVVISPFGDTGPYVDAGLPTNEFLLQAMCGSIGGRGWPESEPVQAGGRLGEWFAGSFAAVAAAASVRRARRTGAGETIDLSIYEAMVIAMGSLGAVSASVLGEDRRSAREAWSCRRSCRPPTVWWGSARSRPSSSKISSYLIERPDLFDDEDLASMPGRIARRDEFLAMVHDWAADKYHRRNRRTRPLPSESRSPRSALPRRSSSIDHFVERGVFVESDARRHRATGSVPEFGHTGPPTRDAHPKWAPTTDGCTGRQTPPRRRSRHRACSRWPESASSTSPRSGPVRWRLRSLAALGADVIKVEGVRRPDGMRFAGGRPPSWDRWWEWGPVFQCSNTNKRGITLELSTPRGREVALDLIARSDIVIENFSPRVHGATSISNGTRCTTPIRR